MGYGMACNDAKSIYDPLYVRGIVLFNEEDFFECHEIWEELWRRERGPSRQFYKGLIQAAVSLYHSGRGNLRGARTLSARSRACLMPYRPNHLGLNLDAFLAALEGYLDAFLTGDRRAAERAKKPRISLEIRPDSPSR